MNLRPTQARGVAAPAGATPTRSTKPATPAAPAVPPLAAPVDHVELSSEARALSAAHAAHEARVAELAQRVAAGFYDRPEVRAQVVDRLAADVTRADGGDA